MIRHTLFPCLLVTAVTGCAAVPLEQASSLSSYESLAPVKSRFRKANYMVSAEDVKVAKTVYIEPTKVSDMAAPSIKKSSDRALVANMVSRGLCVGVSDRFQVVDNREDADLIVHATVTRIVPTNTTAAGVSTAAALGATIAQSSVPVPRIPLGLGGLSVEGEATTREGKQVAALVWAKGASLLTGPRVSQVGDAYSLAEKFGDDFSKMLITGKTPYKGLPRLPSGQKIMSSLGGKPKYRACEKFGRSPFLMDAVASQVGAPPSWTDKSAPEQVYASIPQPPE
ncbi:DUF3313 domain-containing protein [Mesorhizobium sp. IMUNJ 23232]|uniref:DUF3313 domain-containing protein n=1 Tax=Mesorhizobium sp. IMUNJ 23232 TaxID=3376064 RepID=UPI003789DCA1